jgi:hypothetical protein
VAGASENIVPDIFTSARGRFWWATETVPDGQYCPDDSVAGSLTIEANGRARLDCDGSLKRSSPAILVWSDAGEIPPVAGYLLDDRQNSQLSQPHTRPGTARLFPCRPDQYRRICAMTLRASLKSPPEKSHSSFLLFPGHDLVYWNIGGGR